MFTLTLRDTLTKNLAGLFFFGSAVLMSSTILRAESARPNILLCVADDAGLHAGAYGTDWVSTPTMDRLADHGLLFQRAYTPNSKCGPSRACILTGRNSWQLKEAGNHWASFPLEFKSVAEVLNENGYHVGYTGKGWLPGKAFDANGKRRDVLVNQYTDLTLDPPTSGIHIVDYVANFKTFLNDGQSEEPFFFWYGGWEPHRKYEFQSGRKVGGKSLEDVKWIPEFWPDTDVVRDDILDYVFELEYFDARLGEMVDELEARGILDNTIIIVTSDNGMPFPRVKGQTYEYSNHLPLIIYWPEGIRSAGRSVDEFVSLIDLVPTFLEVAGIEADHSGMASITGRSLSPILENRLSEQVRDHVLLGKERHDVGRPNNVGYPTRAIVEGDFLYIINFEPGRWPVGNPEAGYANTDGGATKTEILEGRTDPSLHHFWQWNFGKRPQEELYQISEDPDCLRNLAGYPEFVDKRNKLRLRLLQRLTDEGDPRMAGHGDIFDEYLYMDPKSTHLYERTMEGVEVRSAWLSPSDFEAGPVDIETLE